MKDWESGTRKLAAGPYGVDPNIFDQEISVETTQKIPGDRLVLGMLSAFRTLVWQLSGNGVINLDEFVTALQQTAAEHRQTGDPNNLANAIHAISVHIQSSVPT